LTSTHKSFLIAYFVTILEMESISWQAIYVLWLREMKGMWRAKSRVVGEELLNPSLTQ
jgi:hypothetical protein